MKVKTFKGIKNLPEGISIYLNDYDEFVAVEFGKIAQFENKNIRASNTFQGAVENYLNHKTMD